MSDEDIREFLIERAGIREYNAGYSREEAEELAREDLRNFLRKEEE